jgi:hypothetical protein
MVIADFNVVRVTIHKPETDPPLIVDGNRMLALSITFKRVQTIARGRPQIAQIGRQVDVLKLTRRSPGNV